MIMRTKSWLLCLVAIFCACGSQDADKGVERKLPSVKEEHPIVQQHNILVVEVNSDGHLLVDNENVDIKQLKDRSKAFFKKHEDGIISLRTDRSISYNLYFEVQDSLTDAIIELRNEMSMREFGCENYRDLEDDQRKIIEEAIPMAISETKSIRR